MPLVVADQEQEPVINLEKEVFDLDTYSYNQTLVTSNVNTNCSSVTTSSSPAGKYWFPGRPKDVPLQRPRDVP